MDQRQSARPSRPRRHHRRDRRRARGVAAAEARAHRLRLAAAGGQAARLAAANDELAQANRALIEAEIGNFTVIEHDQVIFGCAAMYAFPEERMAEMACLAVNPTVQSQGDGERLLQRIEQRAREAGITRLFVLTTRTAHWFLKRGFVMGSVDDLPGSRRNLYNWQRRSQVLLKTL